MDAGGGDVAAAYERELSLLGDGRHFAFDCEVSVSSNDAEVAGVSRGVSGTQGMPVRAPGRGAWATSDDGPLDVSPPTSANSSHVSVPMISLGQRCHLPASLARARRGGAASPAKTSTATAAQGVAATGSRSTSPTRPARRQVSGTTNRRRSVDSGGGGGGGSSPAVKATGRHPGTPTKSGFPSGRSSPPSKGTPRQPAPADPDSRLLERLHGRIEDMVNAHLARVLDAHFVRFYQASVRPHVEVMGMLRKRIGGLEDAGTGSADTLARVATTSAKELALLRADVDSVKDTLDRQRAAADASGVPELRPLAAHVDNMRRDVAELKIDMEASRCRLQSEVEGVVGETRGLRERVGDLRLDVTELRAGTEEVARLRQDVDALKDALLNQAPGEPVVPTADGASEGGRGAATAASTSDRSAEARALGQRADDLPPGPGAEPGTHGTKESVHPRDGAGAAGGASPPRTEASSEPRHAGDLYAQMSDLHRRVGAAAAACGDATARVAAVEAALGGIGAARARETGTGDEVAGNLKASGARVRALHDVVLEQFDAVTARVAAVEAACRDAFAVCGAIAERVGGGGWAGALVSGRGSPPRRRRLSHPAAAGLQEEIEGMWVRVGGLSSRCGSVSSGGLPEGAAVPMTPPRGHAADADDHAPPALPGRLAAIDHALAQCDHRVDEIAARVATIEAAALTPRAQPRDARGWVDVGVQRQRGPATDDPFNDADGGAEMDATAALAARVAALEVRASVREGEEQEEEGGGHCAGAALRIAMRDLTARVEVLEDRDRCPTTVRAADAVGGAAGARRLAELEDKVRRALELAKAANQDAGVRRLREVSARCEALEQRIVDNGAAGTGGRPAGARRLAKVEDDVRRALHATKTAEQASAALRELAVRVRALENRSPEDTTAAAVRNVDAEGSSGSGPVSPTLARRLAAVEQRVARLPLTSLSVSDELPQRRPSAGPTATAPRGGASRTHTQRTARSEQMTLEELDGAGTQAATPTAGGKGGARPAGARSHAASPRPEAGAGGGVSVGRVDALEEMLHQVSDVLHAHLSVEVRGRQTRGGACGNVGSRNAAGRAGVNISNSNNNDPSAGRTASTRSPLPPRDHKRFDQRLVAVEMAVATEAAALSARISRLEAQGR